MASRIEHSSVGRRPSWSCPEGVAMLVAPLPFLFLPKKKKNGRGIGMCGSF